MAALSLGESGNQQMTRRRATRALPEELSLHDARLVDKTLLSYTGKEGQLSAQPNDPDAVDTDEEPAILAEIEVEDLAVDGICGVY